MNWTKKRTYLLLKENKFTVETRMTLNQSQDFKPKKDEWTVSQPPHSLFWVVFFNTMKVNADWASQSV